MKAIEMKKDVYYVGARDAGLRVFDIVMETEFGTTYNSYLIKGEKNVLIETAKAKKWGTYFAQLEEVLNGEEIHYIIINHTEPDHTGSLKMLLEKFPNAHIYCSKPASMYLKNIMNREFAFTAVQDGEVIELSGRHYKFISAPFLHWPDTMFTYVEEEKLLFTCDFLGCHFCPGEGELLNDTITNEEGFMRAFKYYYDAIMSPFREHVLNGIKKIEGIDYEMICPSHGPVIKYDIHYYIDHYLQWSHELLQKKDKKYIIIPYVSAYGYTKMIADTLEKTILEHKDCYVEAIDLVGANLAEVAGKITMADGILVGSPTLNQDALKPVWDLLSMVSPILVRNKHAAAFGSYGWSGEAVKLLEQRMTGLKFKVVESGLRFSFMPSEQDLEKTVEFGKQFADLI